MMRTWFIAVLLGVFCFILPIQFFIIGDNSGQGMQGAVYRYMITPQGTSLVPVTSEITYVTSGTYTGRSALMVIFWSLATLVLSGTTAGALILWNRITRKQMQIITISMAVSGLGYLASCISQYGPLLQGPAGKSIPFGVFLLLGSAVLLWYYPDEFFITPDMDPDRSEPRK